MQITQLGYIEWQWPHSDVHSIMMVNQPSLVRVRVGVARPSPFTLSTITSKVGVYAVRVEGRYTPSLSSLPLYALCDVNLGSWNESVHQREAGEPDESAGRI